MLNIIQNTIGAIRRVGESVVRAGLKMWLPFTKAITFDVEEVLNGNFTTDSNWYNVSGTGWEISGDSANHTGATNFLEQDTDLLNGITYIVQWSVTNRTSGTLGVSSHSGDRTGADGVSANGDYTTFLVSNGNNLRFYATGNASIQSVSVKQYIQTTPDISGNDNNAILKTGKALQFTGNDSVETSFPSSYTIKTIAFWIKPTHSSTNETVFYGGGGMGGTRQLYLDHLQLEAINSNISMSTYVNGSFEGVTANGTPATLTQDEWQRVVLTSSTGFSVVSDTFDIASGLYGHDGRFIMSDLQIYNEAWTTVDIAYDYANPQKFVTDNTSSSISLSNLKGYWAFTEGAGGIAYDSSGGTAYNGTISGASYVDAQERILQLAMISWAKSTPVSDEIVLPYSPNNVTQDILGNAVRIKGSGFNLDGTGYGEVPHTTDFDFGTGDFSVSAWAKFSYTAKGSSFNAIYTNGGQVDATNTFSIISVNTNKIAVLVNGTSAVSTSTFSNGEWVHIVATRNSGTISLYINGNKTPEDTDTNSNTVTSNQNPRIGFDNNVSRLYNDLIDDVQVYNRALTPDEVEQNYNATKTGHNN